MTPLVLIRHGLTQWNVEGRIQGRTDIPLNAEGRTMVASYRLPPGIDGYDWVSSPLVRAVETASLLGVPGPTLEPRLAEMSWGEWEGMLRCDLRRDLGPAMAENEARGLDFRPPGGESPRELVARVSTWLAEVARRGRPTVAVVHHGVIRGVLALATGWDMTGRPAVKPRNGGAHFFDLDAQGVPRVDRLNVALAPP